MTITMTREALREGLDIVVGAIKEKNTLPVLGMVLAEVAPEGLRLTATDLDQLIRTTVPADMNGKGAKQFTIPGKRLAAIAKQLPNAAVKLEHTGKQVRIQCGKVDFDLNAMSWEEFPGVPPIAFEQAWTIPAVELAHVDDVAFAAGTDEARRAFTGILWQCRNGRMRMVATNGHRIAIREAGSCCDGQKDLLVPAKAMELVARLFDAEELIEVAATENHLGFRSPRLLVISRLLDETYPNYEQIFPREYASRVTLDRELLLEVCKRLATVAESPYLVRCDFESTRCLLSVQAGDVGKGHEDLACAMTGPPVTIGFNLHYLQDAAAHMRTDQINVGLNEGNTAALFTPMDDPDYSQLIMPLRSL